MKFNIKCSVEPSHQPPKIDKEFGMDSYNSQELLQDFQHLDDLSFTKSSFNLTSNGIQTTDFDSFDLFSNASSITNFNLLDFNPFEKNDTNDDLVINNFEGGSIFKYANMQTPLMDVNSLEHYIEPMSRHFKPLYISVQDNKFSNNGLSSSMERMGELKSESANIQWTIKEDSLLVHFVEKFGTRKWSHIAPMLKERTGKQCRERWHNQLRPDIKICFLMHFLVRVKYNKSPQGPKWSKIAKRLLGRIDNSIKNHWNASKRRQCRQKYNSKWPKPSAILHNYIKSLNSEKGSTGTRTHSLASARAPTINYHTENSLSNDQLVPDYDTGGVSEFALDDLLIEGNYLNN